MAPSVTLVIGQTVCLHHHLFVWPMESWWRCTIGTGKATTFILVLCYNLWPSRNKINAYQTQRTIESKPCVSLASLAVQTVSLHQKWVILDVLIQHTLGGQLLIFSLTWCRYMNPCLPLSCIRRFDWIEASWGPGHKAIFVISSLGIPSCLVHDPMSPLFLVLLQKPCNS